LTAPRVALVGARRVRQGLGPFVARDLVAAGARITGVVGTSAESAAAAGRDLQAALGIEVRTSRDLRDLLAREALDALVILSPSATHEAYLRAALDAGLHVLCEKPLVWGGEGLARRSEALASGFERKGLLLRENCQWPYVLPAYQELHGLPERAPARFAMRLAPDSTGVEMLGDALSHPLSVLQALVPGPDPRAERPRFRTRPGPLGATRIGLDFVYRTQACAVDVEVELEQTDVLPRPASLAVDGRWAERRVSMPGYTLHLTADARAVKVRDPLTVLIEDFVAQLRALRGGGLAPAPPTYREIVERMRLLESLVLAYASGDQQEGDEP
jgi:predicted dehydrogenase